MSIEVGGPIIGQWYAHIDKDELFQIVGRDEQSRAIEIQYVGGDIDEIEAEEWGRLPLERREPPEDSTAPMDDIGQERDPLGEAESEELLGADVPAMVERVS